MKARVIYLVLGMSVWYVFGSKPIIRSNVASPTSYAEMTPSSLTKDPCMNNFREIGPLRSILLHSPCLRILTLHLPFTEGNNCTTNVEAICFREAFKIKTEDLVNSALKVGGYLT